MFAATVTSQLILTKFKIFKWILLCLFIGVLSCYKSIHAQPPPPNSTACTSTTWVNSTSLTGSITFEDGTIIRPILTAQRQDKYNNTILLQCGFASIGAIAHMSAYEYSKERGLADDQVLWSVNRDNPIRENGTLELTADGDLALKDMDGTKVWSSDTSNKRAAALSMLNTGNLVFFNQQNVAVSQSFDHPTDTLMLRQQVVSSQRLTASNWTTGQFFIAFGPHGLAAFVDSNQPQMYFPFHNGSFDTMLVLNGSLRLLIRNNKDGEYVVYRLPCASSLVFLRMKSNGHFVVYKWKGEKWKVMSDFFSFLINDCDYPTVSGNYGICSNGQCSCPGGRVTDDHPQYSDAIYGRQINLG